MVGVEVVALHEDFVSKLVGCPSIGCITFTATPERMPQIGNRSADRGCPRSGFGIHPLDFRKVRNSKRHAIASVCDMETPPLVGVIGGSGFYSLLDDAEARRIDTPYGEPSDAITVGTLGGRRVAFLPRHGAGHRFPPHLVPYRANLWALRSLGARQVLSLSAVGSLTTQLPQGTLVVPDQIADRTHAREHTYFSHPGGVGHATFADPYCPRLRGAAAAAGPNAHNGGTLVVVNGPRFSTRAESREFQSHGWSLIGMTAMPEAGLARELALCYATLALVTDLDAGVEAGEGVTHAEVLAQFAANLPKLRELLVGTVAAMPADQDGCDCGDTSAHPPDFVLP
jgi:5'-methylthioadenosine phosphorylase